MNASKFQSNNGTCSGTVIYDNDKIYIQGKCVNIKNAPLSYTASAPADRRAASMGSGLPFGTPEMAYEGTPNKGIAVINEKGLFQFMITKPNSYYVKGGSMMIPPHVHVTIGNEYFVIPLGQPIPNRSLSNLPGMPIRSSRR